MVTSGDDFFDRLRTLNQQSRRIATSEGEILNEYLQTDEDFALTHSTPTVTIRAAGTQTYLVVDGTVPQARKIIAGEWVVRT